MSTEPDRSGTKRIEDAVDEDRRQTDTTLDTERRQTDQLLESERVTAAQQQLEDRRTRPDRRLQQVREETDNHLRVQETTLPELSEKFGEVSIDLARTADAAAAAPDTPAELIERLAEIAATMADVTADLEAERQAADRKLQVERETTDLIIEQQIEQQIEMSEAHAAVDRAEQSLLEAERQATDEDLARERRHTDQAIEQVVVAFEHEHDAHTAVRHEFASRTEFLAIVSHDLRGPLAAASAAAALIAGAAVTHGELGKIRLWADRITRSLATMDRLIRDLLDFASFEDGKLKLDTVEQDVRLLIEHAVEMFLPLATTKQLSLSAQLPPHPVFAPYDRDRLLQVVANLLQNAIKFTPPGGAIRVQIAETAAECTVSVSDTGIGIPEAEMNTIFDRFRQIDASRAGLGLGLYIAKWIVEAHNGRIWAESGRTVGSTVSFTLPRR